MIDIINVTDSRPAETAEKIKSHRKTHSLKKLPKVPCNPGVIVRATHATKP